MEQLDLLSILGELMKHVLSALPNILAALFIALIGYILSRQLAKVFRKFLAKTKIDEYADRLNEIDVIQRMNRKFVLSKILAKILYYVLMLFFLIVAADILNMEAVTNVVTNIIEFIPRLVTAFAILLVGVFISDSLRKIVLTACQSLNIPAAKIIAAFVFYFILINVVITALQQAGVETEILSQNISIILGGIVLAFGLGYGFASRDIFSGMLSYHYYQDILKQGRKVTIDGITGIIVDSSRNHIAIKDDNQHVVYVPTHKINKVNIIFHN